MQALRLIPLLRARSLLRYLVNHGSRAALVH
jgi:hypothetical protein